MYKLKIISCDDQRKWYAGLIGQTVDFISEDIDHFEYKSREVDTGYINFVTKTDAELVWVKE